MHQSIKRFSFCLLAILFLTALAVGQKREEVLVAKVYKGLRQRISRLWSSRRRLKKVGYDSITPTRYLSLVLDLIKELESSYSIDINRRYVLGQSMGGFGTFAILTMQPNMFAAAVPVCGGGDESKAAQIAHIPIWAFHGELDQAVRVERSRNMIAALTKAGGKPKYTEYKGEGHTIWTSVVMEPDLLGWMFSQKRSER